MKLGPLLLAATVLLDAALISRASAQGAPTSAPLALAANPGQLKPGQWVWDAMASPAGPMLVYVDLTRQIATVYRNGVRIAVSTISSGKPGHDTPTGVFTILQKDANHHSSKYNDAPMPFTERLTWDGVALHAGGLPGYPSSHGCVHLPLEFAKLLFGIESLGGTVIISGGHNDPALRSAAGILEPAVPGAAPPPPLASGQPFNWTPAAAPAGPVSIIVSTADQQILVLRNGTEIGRSRAALAPVGVTRVLTYSGNKEDHWIEVGVGGAKGQSTAGGAIDIGQLRLPAAFATNLRSIIAPGITLLITPDALTQQTGTQTTLLSASGEAR